MNLLDNELVCKYFGWCSGHFSVVHATNCKNTMALEILEAMQQPIAKMERFLFIYGDKIQEQWRGGDLQIGEFHPFHLRLPDRWQGKKECEGGIVIWRHQTLACDKCNQPIGVYHQPPPETEYICTWHDEGKHGPKCPDFKPETEKCGECGREK